jgi:hypothetical protein
MELSLAVCSDHFIEEQFTNLSHRKLKDDVIPTVFPVVQSSYDSCILDTQNICEVEEPMFTGIMNIILFPHIWRLKLRLINPLNNCVKLCVFPENLLSFFPCCSFHVTPLLSCCYRNDLCPYSRLSRQETILFPASSCSVVLTRLSGPRSRPTTSQKDLVVPGIKPRPLDL